MTKMTKKMNRGVYGYATAEGGNPGADTPAARALAGCAAANFLRTAGSGEALRSLSDRGLGDAGALEVAAYIASELAPYEQTVSEPSLARLRAVGLQHNGIGPAGCRALASALGTLSALDELAMYSNGERGGSLTMVPPLSLRLPSGGRGDPAPRARLGKVSGSSQK